MSMSDRAKIEEAISSAALCGVTVQVTQGLCEHSLCSATARGSNVMGATSTCINANELKAVTEAIANYYKKVFGGAVN